MTSPFYWVYMFYIFLFKLFWSFNVFFLVLLVYWLIICLRLNLGLFWKMMENVVFVWGED